MWFNFNILSNLTKNDKLRTAFSILNQVMDKEFPKGIILTLNRIIFDLEEIGNFELADLMRKFMQILLRTLKIEFQINSDDSHSYSFKHKIRLISYLCLEVIILT